MIFLCLMIVVGIALLLCLVFGIALIVGMVSGLVEVLRGRTTTVESPTEGQRIYGFDDLYVGARVVNPLDGTHAEVLELLDDDWVVLCFDDGQVRRVHVRPADSQVA